MKDVILWTAVFGPFVLGLIVMGFAVVEQARLPASEHKRYSDMDDALKRQEHAYNVAYGKTLPCAAGESWERSWVLRPPPASDQSGDSRRRGDC
jgi:hypothetical protein